MPRGPRQPHDAYAALRSANYRRFASGFAVSSTGLQMMGTAVGWEVYDRTDSAMALGYTGLTRALPVIVLALPAGQIIDLFDRRRVLVLTQAAFALCLAGLAAVSYFQGPVWLIYAALFLTGCARVFNGPSRSSLLPQIIEPGVFHNAVTWNSGVFQFSAMAGPLAAGVILAEFHAAWPVYLITAAGCATFAVSASFIRPREAARATGGFTLRSMAEGVDHLRREKTVLGAITLDLFAVLLGGATAMLPIYQRDILKVGPEWLGVLRAAPFVGALVMSLVLAHRPPFRRAGAALLWSVAGFGAATAVFGLAPWLWLSVAALTIAGAVDNISVVVRHVLVQVRTPEHLRGRVSAVNTVFIESSNELGAFESGLLAAWLGPVFSVVSGGLGTIAVAAWVAWMWPPLRRLGALHEEHIPPAAPAGPAGEGETRAVEPVSPQSPEA